MDQHKNLLRYLHLLAVSPTPWLAWVQDFLLQLFGQHFPPFILQSLSATHVGEQLVIDILCGQWAVETKHTVPQITTNAITITNLTEIYLHNENIQSWTSCLLPMSDCLEYIWMNELLYSILSPFIYKLQTA